MVHNNCITISLGLQEFSVSDVRELENEIYVEVVRKWDYAICPYCGCTADKVHQATPRKVEDLPIYGKRVMLIVNKRRFRCLNCGKVFTESFESIERRGRRTIRYERYLYKRGKKVSLKELSLQEGIKYSTCRRIWYRRANRETRSRVRPVVRVMGMDEFSRERGHKFNTVITDVENRKLIDVITGNDKSSVEEYLRKIPVGLKPSIFVIDIWRPFISAIKDACPGAVIVIDKFHVIRLVNEAMDRLRRIIQKIQPRGKKRELFRIRRILLKAKENLTPQEKKRLDSVLSNNYFLHEAYDLKEVLRDCYSDITPELIEDWCKLAETSGLTRFTPFKKLTCTLLRWKVFIANYGEYKVTNGYTEGVNNRIKLDKRIAFGYRNFDNQRTRILVSLG